MLRIDHVAGIPVASADRRDRPPLRQGRAHLHPLRSGIEGRCRIDVKIAKAELVPTDANLLPDYTSFADLEAACERSLPP